MTPRKAPPDWHLGLSLAAFWTALYPRFADPLPKIVLAIMVAAGCVMVAWWISQWLHVMVAALAGRTADRKDPEG
jgi:hypothetical protein